MKDLIWKLDNDALIRKFATIAAERGAATADLDIGRANILFDRMKAIDAELRRRGPLARLAMAPLLNDADRFIRYYAALYLLGLLPDQSRAIMEWNAKYGADSLAADARMYLRSLDDGSYRPD